MEERFRGLPETERTQLRRDLEAIAKGEVDGIRVLEGYFDRFPDSIEVMGHLSWAYARKGRHEEAIALCRRCLEAYPGDSELEMRIGDRLLNVGRWDEALEQYQSTLARHPESLDAKMGIRYVRYLRRKHGDHSFPLGIPEKPEPTPDQVENERIHEEEYRNCELGLRSLPIKVNVASTTKCDFYCKSCSKHSTPYFAEDVHDDVVDRVEAMLLPTTQILNLTGFGEPTIASNFDRLLALSEKFGIAIEFVTNGSLLNYERLENLMRRHASIAISIDGSTKETFEFLREGGNYDLILEKAAMAKRLRAIFLSRVYSRIEINFLALRDNIQEFPEVVRMSHRLGVDRINVLDYIPQGKKFDEQSLSYNAEKGNRYLGEGEQLARDLNVPLIRPDDYVQLPPPGKSQSLWSRIRGTRRLFPEKNRFPKRCKSPWMETYIDTDGTVTPCCVSFYRVGNLKKTEFHKIWNGWRYRLFRWRIDTTLPHLDCRRCQIWWGINDSNPANVMGREGLLVKVFYFGERAIYAVACRWQRVLKKVRGEKDPEPNYQRGRPIAPRSRRAGSSVAK